MSNPRQLNDQKMSVSLAMLKVCNEHIDTLLKTNANVQELLQLYHQSEETKKAQVASKKADWFNMVQLGIGLTAEVITGVFMYLNPSYAREGYAVMNVIPFLNVVGLALTPTYKPVGPSQVKEYNSYLETLAELNKKLASLYPSITLYEGDGDKHSSKTLEKFLFEEPKLQNIHVKWMKTTDKLKTDTTALRGSTVEQAIQKIAGIREKLEKTQKYLVTAERFFQPSKLIQSERTNPETEKKTTYTT